MGRQDEAVFRDIFFRNKKKKGAYRIVEPPFLLPETPLADTHAHLALLDDVPLTLARSAVYGVSFIGAIADIHEKAADVYEKLEEWQAQTPEVIDEIRAASRALLGSDPLLFSEEAREAYGSMLGVTGDVKSDSVAEASLSVPHIRIVVGCHPHNAKYYDDRLEMKLLGRLRDPRTCAIGEVGLDYHYDLSPREAQREAFKRQIALVHRTGLPLILHLREAHDEALQIMDEEGFPAAGTLLHCFNLDWETLEPWVERGCSAAFGGALTFKKSEDTRKALTQISLDRIMTETDAPFMAPEPLRGMTCSPEQTVFTAQLLAQTRGCETDASRKTLLEQLYRNACDFLDRSPVEWQQESAAGQSEAAARQSEANAEQNEAADKPGKR